MTRRIDYAFLHGGMQGSWVWDDALSALMLQAGALGARTLALDIPGCGVKRGRQTDETAIADIARELVHEIESAGWHEIVLVGHSQAGTVLPSMLRLAPELLRRAIYISCIAPATGQTALQFGESLRDAPAQDGNWDFGDMFCNDMGDAQKAAFLSQLGADAWPQRSYVETQWQYERPASIDGTYVCCLQDRTVPLTKQLECADRFRVNHSVSIDAGHQVMLTRPQALAEVIRLEAAR